MERKIILTGDGSHSIRMPELGVAYHSVHGAIQESKHVFIEAGFKSACTNQSVCSILEVGFGTGLNALLTYMEAEKTGTKIYYETLEPNPLNNDEAKSLNYCHQLNRKDLQPLFEQMHFSDWEKAIPITPRFILAKRNSGLGTFNPLEPSFAETTEHKPFTPFELIYYDAFAPAAQPELWTKEVFDKMFSLLAPGGVLVTYCSKGEVRRNMMAAGFKVEKLPGPLYKREMLRARR
jgi:tRNA U34 5-methylaminomethyl-2-thiouridine-forming methyltransferase MnmC